jgi:hypothetical protein
LFDELLDLALRGRAGGDRDELAAGGEKIMRRRAAKGAGAGGIGQSRDVAGGTDQIGKVEFVLGDEAFRCLRVGAVRGDADHHGILVTARGLKIHQVMRLQIADEAVRAPYGDQHPFAGAQEFVQGAILAVQPLKDRQRARRRGCRRGHDHAGEHNQVLFPLRVHAKYVIEVLFFVRKT